LEQAKTQLANVGTDHENLKTSIKGLTVTVGSHTKELLSRATISSVSRLEAEWEGVAPSDHGPGLCEFLSDLKSKIKSIDHKLSQVDNKIESGDDRAAYGNGIGCRWYQHIPRDPDKRVEG
jgi:hypothetical protein